MNFKTGKIFTSLSNNPLASEGIMGIMVRPEKNGFLNNKPSIIVVWENDKFTEYFEEDIDVELAPTDLHTGFLDTLDFSTDQKITESIKSSFFAQLFKQLKESAQNQVGQ